MAKEGLSSWSAGGRHVFINFYRNHWQTVNDMCRGCTRSCANAQLQSSWSETLIAFSLGPLHGAYGLPSAWVTGGFLFISHFVGLLLARLSVFSTSTTTSKLPRVFLQLVPYCRRKRNDVNNFIAGSHPVGPYGFIGVDHDYLLCSVAYEKWKWYSCITAASGDWYVLAWATASSEILFNLLWAVIERYSLLLSSYDI